MVHLYVYHYPIFISSRLNWKLWLQPHHRAFPHQMVTRLFLHPQDPSMWHDHGCLIPNKNSPRVCLLLTPILTLILTPNLSHSFQWLRLKRLLSFLSPPHPIPPPFLCKPMYPHRHLPWPLHLRRVSSPAHPCPARVLFSGGSGLFLLP